jgi:hypothetical protein
MEPEVSRSIMTRAFVVALFEPLSLLVTQQRFSMAAVASDGCSHRLETSILRRLAS